MDCYSEHFFSLLTWEWMWGIDLGEGPHRSFTNESGHMVSCKCFVQGKENGIRCIPPPNPRFNTPSVPRGQDGKIKDTFGGRKAMNHQFTSSLHASHAKGQKWQTLPWLDLCSQEIWRVALPRQREAPSPRMPLAFCPVLYQSALHSLFPVYCDSLLLFL